jgi:hypothetical protein
MVVDVGQQSPLMQPLHSHWLLLLCRCCVVVLQTDDNKNNKDAKRQDDKKETHTRRRWCRCVVTVMLPFIDRLFANKLDQKRFQRWFHAVNKVPVQAIGLIQEAVDGCQALPVVLFVLDDFDVAALFANNGHVEFGELAEATGIAQERIAFVIVDCPTLVTLEDIFTAIVANTRMCVDCCRTTWTLQLFDSQLRLVLVELDIFEHDIGCHDWQTEIDSDVVLTRLQFDLLRFEPHVRLVLELDDRLYTPVVVINAYCLYHFCLFDVIQFDVYLAYGIC